MILRDRQLSELEQIRQAAFEARAFEHFTSSLESSLHEERLRESIHRYVAEAFEFKIENEDDIIRYVELRIDLGDSQWTSANFVWIHEYLREWSRASIRLDHAIERLRFGDEEVA